MTNTTAALLGLFLPMYLMSAPFVVVLAIKIVKEIRDR